MIRLVLMGPPGVGKGTQSTQLSRHLDIPAISTGDLFRDHVRRQTPLGRQISATLSSGALVDDDVVVQVLAETLGPLHPESGFILDGFPRNETQVGELLGLLASQEREIDAVIVLDAPRETTSRRILSRGEGRADDTADVAERRRDLFDDEGVRAINVFKERGVPVIEIDGSREPDAVTASILSSLE